MSLPLNDLNFEKAQNLFTTFRDHRENVSNLFTANSIKSNDLYLPDKFFDIKNSAFNACSSYRDGNNVAFINIKYDQESIDVIYSGNRLELHQHKVFQHILLWLIYHKQDIEIIEYCYKDHNLIKWWQFNDNDSLDEVLTHLYRKTNSKAIAKAP